MPDTLGQFERFPSEGGTGEVPGSPPGGTAPAGRAGAIAGTLPRPELPADGGTARTAGQPGGPAGQLPPGRRAQEGRDGLGHEPEPSKEGSLRGGLPSFGTSSTSRRDRIDDIEHIDLDHIEVIDTASRRAACMRCTQRCCAGWPAQGQAQAGLASRRVHQARAQCACCTACSLMRACASRPASPCQACSSAPGSAAQGGPAARPGSAARPAQMIMAGQDHWGPDDLAWAILLRA